MSHNRKKQLSFFQNIVNQLCAATLAALVITFMTLMSSDNAIVWLVGLYTLAASGALVIGWLAWLTLRMTSNKQFSTMDPKVNRFIDIFDLTSIAYFIIMCSVPATRTPWALAIVWPWWAVCVIKALKSK